MRLVVKNITKSLKFATSKTLEDPIIAPGRYRHYKGNDYQVIGTATHSESNEIVVVYKPLYNDSGLWVRPIDMFRENVEVEGEQIPRFRLIK
ncbi:MAG: DUF1653 domain-containing protein [Gammaproteobacteria bacterium]|nr:DUF1653 domain-containing protein [Gammaproteobacteria bacterium]NNM14417.1 DUF1653 domain-containing protein [Gammaproteobacteria bacterium]